LAGLSVTDKKLVSCLAVDCAIVDFDREEAALLVAVPDRRLVELFSPRG
jgi:hypothetical protein